MLGDTFAVFAVLASFGIGNMTQANSIADALSSTFRIPNIVTGVVITTLALVVLVGGIKSIGKVCEKWFPLWLYCISPAESVLSLSMQSRFLTDLARYSAWHFP